MNDANEAAPTNVQLGNVTDTILVDQRQIWQASLRRLCQQLKITLTPSSVTWDAHQTSSAAVRGMSAKDAATVVGPHVNHSVFFVLLNERHL